MIFPEALVETSYGRQYYIHANDTFFRRRIEGACPYQMQNLIALRRLVPHARVILDIGMNIGMNTVEYATFADEVHGFEPTPQTYDMAIRSIGLNLHKKATQNWFRKYDFAANMTPDANVITHMFGIGDVPGNYDILIMPNNAGQNHIDNIDYPTKTGRKRTRKRVPYTEEIEVKTLDQLNYTDVDIIKLDIEGYEYAALVGSEDTIMRERPVVQVEMIDEIAARFGRTCQDIVDWFVQRDYNMYTSDAEDVGTTWKVIPKRVERFFVPKERPLNRFYK